MKTYNVKIIIEGPEKTKSIKSVKHYDTKRRLVKDYLDKSGHNSGINDFNLNGLISKLIREFELFITIGPDVIYYGFPGGVKYELSDIDKGIFKVHEIPYSDENSLTGLEAKQINIIYKYLKHKNLIV